MLTEDLKLDVKEIFVKKKVPFTGADVARARYACAQILEFLIEYEKLRMEKNDKTN